MTKEQLLIIGAGAAGLFAAKELSGDFDITIIEAAPWAGGRMRTVYDCGFSKPVEMGAEFIHGNLPLSFAIAANAGLHPVPVEGKMYRLTGNIFSEQDAFFRGWDEVIEKMESLAVDMTLQSFLDQHFPGDGHAATRQQLIRFAEGFDLADPAMASVRALCKEWSAEEDNNFRVPGGYVRIVGHLVDVVRHAGVRLLLDDPVVSISWRPGQVEVRTSRNITVHASRAIITVPGNLLIQEQSLLKLHPFPEEYRKAIAGIGMGSVIKILVEFEKRLWPEDAGFIFSGGVIPTWWTQLPNELPLLTGWLGGPQAAQFARKTDQEILDAAFHQLAKMFSLSANQVQSQVKKASVYDWSRDPWSRGAYSFATPASAAARAILECPLEDTIYFAGEYSHGGDHPGTVEAAFQSALEAAKKISQAGIKT